MKSYFIKVQILCTAVLLFSIGLSAQVTIGSDLTPNKGSIVDLKQNDSKDANSNKGLLFSRVELVDINDLEPCIAPADLEPGDKENHI